MPEFPYEVLTKLRKAKKGIIEAEDAKKASKLVREKHKDYYTVWVKDPHKEAAPLEPVAAREDRPKKRLRDAAGRFLRQ